MSLMKGKKGLIMGVANERSIAWGISQKLADAGAELAFTYPADALKKRVIPLAEKLNSKTTFSCDVENKEEVIKLPPFFITLEASFATSVNEKHEINILLKKFSLVVFKYSPDNSDLSENAIA